MRDILFIAAAGAIGSVSRYGLSWLAQKVTGSGFPVGTLLVNTLGSLAIGFVMQLGLDTDVIPRSLRLALTIGFLGAFTTFSTFAWETARYVEDGAWLNMTANIAANIVLCVLGAMLGMFLARTLVGGGA